MNAQERPDTVTLSNPRSDRVKAVARLSGRSARQRERRFLVEGPQAVREAVAAHPFYEPGQSGTLAQTSQPGAIRDLYATHAASQRFAPIIGAAQHKRIAVHQVTDDVFEAMAGPDATVTPQGLLAVCDLMGSQLGAVLRQRPRLVAVLSQVRDPGNAGTVIRAADAAGASAVVLTRSSVDVHNPKCVRSTAGSLFHLPIVLDADLSDLVEALHVAGLWVLAADGAGETDLDDLQDAAQISPGSGLGGPVAWVFGNEARGVDDADAELADDIVRVPVHGRAESLNLATAATVCLYATARAQRARERHT